MMAATDADADRVGDGRRCKMQKIGQFGSHCQCIVEEEWIT
jgi:hypothetical protein